MDILIKGMEMPQEGHIEAYIWCNGTVTYRKKIDNQWDRNSTTAVALPEHGSRCVETNAVVSAITKCFADCKAKGIKPTPFIMSVYIGKVPTILEANNGTDN